jgi:YHS domain-containing protein
MKQKVHLLIILSLSPLTFFVSCGQQGESKPYPLDYCLVGGSDLGDMGEPVSYVHNGQEFKFCCKPCIPKFKKNPEKFIQELKEESKGL